MLSFLKQRWFVIGVGLLLLALFIWYAGPYFAFADVRPLESTTSRLIAIVVVLVAAAAMFVFRRVKANRASDRFVAEVVKAEKRPNPDAVQLRERFEDAIATLKQKRRGGHTLYELPWYVIIGAPGSGKTTALVNSGLHFPLEQRSGKGALRGVGGTRNCDWWFTDEAVLLDTAGRYTTQDSDAEADSAGWTEFLALLRKYRGRRPINGVILTISAQDLMTETPAAHEAHVAAARRRLNELNRELRIQLPVYLLVTKCDLVSGFSEYFDDLAQDGRAQVWGVTFPYEQTIKAEGSTRFQLEFDALIERLNARLFARLEEDRDVRRRAKIFAFPQQMSAMRDVLCQFVTDVFAATRFDQQLVLLRGVYFTSGTQEGTPIDRLLGAMGRRFGIASEALLPSGSRGKAYFIERLLKDVILAESGLAGVNRRFEVQLAATQVGAYAAMAALLITAILVWTVSYSRNRNYMNAVSRDVSHLRDVPPVPAEASLDAALPRLDAVRAVVDSASRFNGGAPWSMRWGLYQPNSIRDAARDAYARELDGAMLPHVAARFRQRLIDYAPEPEKLYPYLKGYLMLGNPEHLDKQQLAYLAGLEWESAYAADPDRAAAVTKHFRNLLQYEDTLRPVPLDERIVAQARSTLQQASLGGLVYRYVRINYANDTSHALRLDVKAGLGAETVLKRKSRVNLSEPIPSIYTKPVFQEITNKGTDDLVKQFTEEYWVWGNTRPPITASAKLSAEFLDIYEKDYITQWDRIVNDIQAAPMGSLEQTKRALEILSAPTSPLRGLLMVIDDNTYLVKPPEQDKGGILPRIGGSVTTIFEAGKQKLGIQTTTPGAQITAHFDKIHQLLAGSPGSTPIDGIVGKLRELQQKLAPIGIVGGPDLNDPQASAGIGLTTNELKRDAAPLPPAIGAVVTQVANGAATAVRGTTRGSLESRYQQDVVRECTTIVANRYPFAGGSTVDVPLADFGRLFGYNGVYDSFFKNELAHFVDTSRSPWAWKNDASGTSVGGSVAMLRQFEVANRIREMFFRNGSQDAEVKFSVAASDLDAAALRFTLELDGQTFDYRHGPVIAKPMTWPGPNPGAAVVTFEERGGARPNLAMNGAWAWFRLLDQAQVQPQTDAAFLVDFEKSSHEARVRIESVSIRNPYAGGKQLLQQFRCG